MLIVINGHITLTPTYPAASPFLSPRAGKDTKSSCMLTEILTNSPRIWSACHSYFNYRSYGEYLMNQADWEGLIRSLRREGRIVMYCWCWCVSLEPCRGFRLWSPFPSPFLPLQLHRSVPARRRVDGHLFLHLDPLMNWPPPPSTLKTLKMFTGFTVLFPSLEQMFETAKNIVTFPPVNGGLRLNTPFGFSCCFCLRAMTSVHF